MRTTHARGLLAAAFALTATTAGAQTAPSGPAPRHGHHGQGASQSGGKDDQQPLVLQKEQLGSTSFAVAARARMRNGDCAGALDAFDAAIAHSIDPTLQRDRGLCFEQLGDPFPAIDDYRAYLTAEPDAPDAEGIRARLARLEQQTSGKSSQAADDDVPPATTEGGGATASGGVAVSVGAGGASADAGGSSGGSTGGPAPQRDTMDYVDRDNDEDKSPLRHGKGWSVAPYFAEHKWFFQNSNFGDAGTWAECIGLQLRYSFGRVPTLFVEGAYQRFNSDETAAAQIQGLTSQVGLELRFPLDAEYDNQLIVAPGIGFDHIVLTSNLLAGQSTSEGAIVPRARVGWRHLFDASAGIDLSADFGVGKFAQYDGDFPFGGVQSETALVALNVALVWGL